MRGLLERVYYVKESGEFKQAPQPVLGVFKERLGYFKTLLARRIGKTTPMSKQDFPSLYQGRKRTIYQNAVDSLAIRSVERSDSYLKTFVKAEKVNFTSKKDPVPRVIQPRDPRYNVEVGRYLKPLEPKIYKAVASIFKDVTIFKGLNAHDSARKMFHKWRKYRKPVAIGLDASRFDQHVSVQALEWEHSIYLDCFSRCGPELARLLSWQVHNKGTGYCRDGKVKYRVSGCRMSGDMNTALGNCIIMCALVHAYCRERGVTKYSLANNGDDCVVIMEEGDVAAFQLGLDTWFREMGFNMKVEAPVYEFEEIEFCQTHPVRVEDCYIPQKDAYEPHYVMVRNAPVAMAKDCISIKPLETEGTYLKWMSAIGDCGLSLTGGVPIYQSFYNGLVRAGDGLHFKKEDTYMIESGKQMMALGMHRKAQTILEHTRYSFWKAFGIVPDMQLQMEGHYDNNTPRWAKPEMSAEPDLLPKWI